jgi:hypothetical protein
MRPNYEDPFPIHQFPIHQTLSVLTKNLEHTPLIKEQCAYNFVVNTPVVMNAT